MTAIVVEAGIAALLADRACSLLRVVPRTDGRRLTGGRPRALDAEAVLDVLADLPPRAIVLARPHAADPGAACLPQLAGLHGVPALRLPAAPEAAAWAVALAVHWAGSGQDDLVRRLEVAVVLPAAPAGRHPAVRPPVLARWARCAWRPCGWCVGGGLPGRCGRCGAGTTA